MTHTLLLADDSVTIQRVIELTFADEDVTVIAVSDGEQAIARIDAAPPDIVLADIGMPGKNGYEVAEHVKQTPRLAHIPVVLLTGAFEPVDHAKATAAGCDGVLAKPFEPQQVIGRVRELLARGAAAAPPIEPAAPAVPPAPKPAPPELDSYFDRLDAAFANLAKEPPPVHSAAPPPIVREVDWFTGTASEPAPTPPSLSYGSAHADFERVAPVPAIAPPPVAPAASSAPTAALPRSATSRGTVPPIAEAFAALLAAEQQAPLPSAAPQWPASIAPAPAPVTITDDLVDQVVRRVLEQMSDRIVRETVRQIVSGVAERLVRDEIDRIKSAIK